MASIQERIEKVLYRARWVDGIKDQTKSTDRAIAEAIMSELEKKLPSEWEKEFCIIIRDPDGWDRKNFDVDWAIPLTRDEFEQKMMRSTIQMLRDPREAPDENRA